MREVYCDKEPSISYADTKNDQNRVVPPPPPHGHFIKGRGLKTEKEDKDK